jgi:hypothetical protein
VGLTGWGGGSGRARRGRLTAVCILLAGSVCPGRTGLLHHQTIGEAEQTEFKSSLDGERSPRRCLREPEGHLVLGVARVVEDLDVVTGKENAEGIWR